MNRWMKQTCDRTGVAAIVFPYQEHCAMVVLPPRLIDQ